MTFDPMRKLRSLFRRQVAGSDAQRAVNKARSVQRRFRTPRLQSLARFDPSRRAQASVRRQLSGSELQRARFRAQRMQRSAKRFAQWTIGLLVAAVVVLLLWILLSSLDLPLLEDLNIPSPGEVFS